MNYIIFKDGEHKYIFCQKFRTPPIFDIFLPLIPSYLKNQKQLAFN